MDEIKELLTKPVIMAETRDKLLELIDAYGDKRYWEGYSDAWHGTA